MLACPQFDRDRGELRRAYGSLGCPSATLEQLLWPQATAPVAERALTALAAFLVNSDLRDEL